MGPVCWARSKGGTFDRLLDASDEKWQKREELLRAGGEEDLGANWRWPLLVDGVTITVQARISVRYNAERDRYEAYARVFHPTAPYDEVLYSGKDVRAAYRAAVQMGPEMEARAYRATRRAARGRAA